MGSEMCIRDRFKPNEMKTFFLLLCLTSALSSTKTVKTTAPCSNNCYLGGTFFSEPLDHRRCCSPAKKDPNCEYYAPMLNSMVCFRCNLGFQWDNNKCVDFGTVKVSKEGRFFLVFNFENLLTSSAQIQK